MVIVQHFPGGVKAYVDAVCAQGRVFPLPERCPHPDCQVVDELIRWGSYQRWARLPGVAYCLTIQRVRCKACGRTHSLLPDFLHPYRHYLIHLLQHVVSLYWNEQLPHMEDCFRRAILCYGCPLAVYVDQGRQGLHFQTL